MAVWSSVELNELSEDLRLDAEHYQPKYLLQQRKMAELPCVELLKIADVSDGNHLSIADEFAEEGIRYLRGKDLSDFFISDTDPIYIPESTYRSLTRSHIFIGDVLVGIVGTIGSVGLVTGRHGQLTGNCKLAIVRAHSLPHEYIAAYLASQIGQNEICRHVRGTVQMGLILPDLKKIPIVIPTDAQSNSIVNMVQTAEHSWERFHELFEEAESFLTDSLGFSQLDLSENLIYERDFTELQSGGRFGAEYFMPCKQRVLDMLADIPSHPLSSHYRSARELFNPKNVKGGEQVRNFDVTDALNPILDDSLTPMHATEVGSTKKKLHAGDVVISRLRSYLQEVALVRTTPAVPAVGSSEFIVLRKRDGDDRALTPETLLVYLRSLPVQTILKWSQDGSQHPRFTEKDLLAIPVPEAIEGISKHVDSLVIEALKARAEAARLLEEAKAEVERLVFGSAR